MKLRERAEGDGLVAMKALRDVVVMLTEPPREEDECCGEEGGGPKDAYFRRHARTLGRMGGRVEEGSRFGRVEHRCRAARCGDASAIGDEALACRPGIARELLAALALARVRNACVVRASLPLPA